MRDDREDWAERLYARIPEVYRTQDLTLGTPLLQLMRAIAGQVSTVRLDMDSLWDDYFIETCADWVVAYLGQLVGTRLLANPVGQSNRLDVRNTILWRRSRGTPGMLGDLAQATTGWRADFVEFFRDMAWVQNLKHVQPQRLCVAALRDPALIALLGGASDPFGHIVDLRPSRDLESAAMVNDPLAPALGQFGLVRPEMGTPGRYQVGKVGFFVRRLSTYPVFGVTPANVTGSAATYQFDPLGRDAPLFSKDAGGPITRAAFAATPATYFGPDKDVAIRRFGVPMALAQGDPPTVSQSVRPFTFGTTSPVKLHPTAGMRAVNRDQFPPGSEHFLITSIWRTPSADITLGALRTLEARLGLDSAAILPGSLTALAGRLVLRIETGPASAALKRPAAGAGRFPACVIAIRDDVTVPRAALDDANRPSLVSGYQDALYVYLPEAYLRPGNPLELQVADDGSTYYLGRMDREHLARSSEGQVWPAADMSRQSVVPAEIALHRRRGIKCLDQARFTDPMIIQALIFTGAAQLLGAMVTADTPFNALPPDLQRELEIPTGQATWNAFQFLPSDASVRDLLPAGGKLLLSVSPLQTDRAQLCPQVEIVVSDRAGNALLVYVPELSFLPGVPATYLFVADDGSTYLAPTFEGGVRDFPVADTFPETALARVSAGQVAPIEGEYPLRRRLVTGGARELGAVYIDPERGGFCLPSGDPLESLGLDIGLTVDYVEAFPDRVGAHTYDREIDYTSSPPTRIVSSSGDTDRAIPYWRIHTTLAQAAALAQDGDVIEIVDSATYHGSVSIPMAGMRRLFIRAANQPRFERPCVVLEGADPALSVTTGDAPLASLELNGLLVAGGRLEVDGGLGQLQLVSCTIDPDSGGAVTSIGGNVSSPASWLLCRSLTGPLRLGASVGHVTVADSILHNPGGLALGGPREGLGVDTDDAAGSVQLERATVLGRIRAYQLLASESILDDLTKVDDRQFGCARFSRYELGSTLPRRYRCVPTDSEVGASPPARAAVVFRSLRTASPTYAMPSIGTAPEVLSASETGDVIGAYAHSYPGLRVSNLRAKLNEFLPVGLEPVVIADT